ncbi:MAG TPA: response regulator [Thermomicrobiales bacterium]|jgi:DNA-binding response OmpR family regulator|nr:response regulator [Thermomicrobiales bacterium]
MTTTPDDRAKLDDFIEDQRRRKHIFMVDSSRTFQHIITALLEDERYGATASDYVPEVFPLILTLKPDLIIVDLVITEKAGWELLEKLEMEALTEKIPVIVTSTDQRLLDQALANKERYGFDNYLVKPFDLEVLLSTIEDLIGAP